MMLVRPSARLAYKTCLRTPHSVRGRGAYITRGTSSVYTYRAVAGGRVGTMRPRAWVTGARGPNAKRVRCADAPTRQHGKRRGARLAETAIARETAARRRRGGAGSLSLSVPLSPLSVDRRRGAPSSSSKRSARVQLCWHISYRGGRGGRGLMQRITFVGARPAAGRWPRGAFGPGNGHGGFPGPRGGRRGPFAAGLPF